MPAIAAAIIPMTSSGTESPQTSIPAPPNVLCLSRVRPFARGCATQRVALNRAAEAAGQPTAARRLLARVSPRSSRELFATVRRVQVAAPTARHRHDPGLHLDAR